MAEEEGEWDWRDQFVEVHSFRMFQSSKRHESGVFKSRSRLISVTIHVCLSTCTLFPPPNVMASWIGVRLRSTWKVITDGNIGVDGLEENLIPDQLLTC